MSINLASFIITRLAPVSIQKDILSVSTVKTIGSDLMEAVGTLDNGIDSSLLRCTFWMTVATYFVGAVDQQKITMYYGVPSAWK